MNSPNSYCTYLEGHKAYDNHNDHHNYNHDKVE